MPPKRPTKDTPETPPTIALEQAVPEPEPEPEQLSAETLRHLELTARGFSAVHTAVKAYQRLRDDVASLVRKKSDLEEGNQKLATQIANSKELQLEAIKRYEKERALKDADEKAAHEKIKSELQQELTRLAEQVQGAQQRVIAANERATEAEKALEMKLADFDDRIALRKNEVEQEIENIEAPIHGKMQELKDLQGALDALRRKHGLA